MSIIINYYVTNLLFLFPFFLFFFFLSFFLCMYTCTPVRVLVSCTHVLASLAQENAVQSRRATNEKLKVLVGLVEEISREKKKTYSRE